MGSKLIQQPKSNKFLRYYDKWNIKFKKMDILKQTKGKTGILSFIYQFDTDYTCFHGSFFMICFTEFVFQAIDFVKRRADSATARSMRS